MFNEELQETLHELKGLLNHAGWKRLTEIAEKQIDLRKAQELAMDVYLEDDIREIQKMKEERRAIQMFINLPESLIEDLELEREELDDVDETDE